MLWLRLKFLLTCKVGGYLVDIKIVIYADFKRKKLVVQ